MKSNQPLIALAMIVKGTDDEAPMLAKCLASINGYVDAIYLNINTPPNVPVSEKVVRVAKQYLAKVYFTEWTGNFVTARQFIFNKVPKKYDWLIWLDADDTVKNPAKIRDIIAVAPEATQCIFVQYDYDHDEYGNCTVTHRVARVVRNNGSMAWQASFKDKNITVHEILSETRSVDKRYSNEFKVVHGSTPQRRRDSLLRNITLLEGMYERQAKDKNVDPRVLYYLGREYFNRGDDEAFDRAEELLTLYIKASGWAEERAEAWLHLGIIWENRGRADAARQAYGHSFLENPKSPRPLVELGKLEFQEKRYLMSEEFLLMAVAKKIPETAYAVFPMENKFRAYLLLVQTYINMGFSKLKDAERYVDMALELRPRDATAKTAQELIVKLRKVRDRTQAVTRLASMFHDEGEPEKIVDVLKLLPTDLQDNPAVILLRQKFTEPRVWPRKSIAIFCGNSAEGIWGPWGIEEGGMGGSEEAVIQLSKQMTKLGWDVTVYATPGAKAGDYEGVHWRQYWEFNPKDKFDVFIAWRTPWFFDQHYSARKSFLWLHDVMDKREFTPERLANIDKVIFMSNFHASLYKGVIPEDKWFVSGNGIDPEQFANTDGKFDRDLHRCLYMSSHVRGLELLYDIWPDVKKAVPDATLDIYYGWKTFDEANKDNPERMAWRDKIQQRARELDGVEDRGRISHTEIAEEIQKSGVLAYPCVFPEVYNISTVKAIAGGCHPVTSDFGCLPDYKDLSTQVHLGKNIESFKRQYARELIRNLLHPLDKDQRRYNAVNARGGYSWSRTAAGWNEAMR